MPTAVLFYIRSEDVDNAVIEIAENIGVSVGKLYMLSNNHVTRKKRKDVKYSNYHTVIIHRGRGHRNRTLHIPNDFLKLVQRRILDSYLYQLEVSDYSTAYSKGSSLRDNASPHIGKECILKLDISQNRSNIKHIILTIPFLFVLLSDFRAFGELSAKSYN